MMVGVADNNQENQPGGQPEERPLEDDRYLNLAASAVLLGVHPGTVRKAISDKRLNSTRVYGRVVVSRAELERYRIETYPDGIPKRGRPGPSADAASGQHDRETS